MPQRSPSFARARSYDLGVDLGCNFGDARPVLTGGCVLALEWMISHPLRLVLARAREDVSPGEIESYFHGVGLEGGISYAKMFLLESASMMSDENLQTLAGIIRRYALVDRIGPVAIVASSDEAHRQATVFASAATAERPIAVFRRQDEAARWLVDMVQGDAAASDIAADWSFDLGSSKD